MSSLILALECDSPSEDQIQCLSSRVMQWSETVWLIDLGPFLEYWRGEAARQRVNVVVLWKMILARQCFGFSDSELKTPFLVETLPIRVVWAPSAWQAVVMLSHMKHAGETGWIGPGSSRFLGIWKGASWDVWDHCCTEIVTYWAGIRPPRFDSSKVNQFANRLKIMAARLGMSTPFLMAQLPDAGIKRRFGVWIGRLCTWYREGANDAESDYFPWQSWVAPVGPTVSRFLDTPTLIWNELVPELVADLDGFAAQRLGGITAISWRVRFETDETVVLDIGFRSPHSLGAELGHHRTALVQFQAAVQSFARRNGQRLVARVVGWQIKITAALRVPPQMMTLFELDVALVHEQKLAQVSNQVIVPLLRFGRVPHWTPELGFSELIAPIGDWNWLLDTSATHRPLFFLNSPQPIIVSKGRGHEVGMAPWWRDARMCTERHYAKVRIGGKWLWAYWDGGRWWGQGVYG